MSCCVLSASSASGSLSKSNCSTGGGLSGRGRGACKGTSAATDTTRLGGACDSKVRGAGVVQEAGDDSGVREPDQGSDAIVCKHDQWPFVVTRRILTNKFGDLLEKI